jgi:hypothetical protein
MRAHHAGTDPDRKAHPIAPIAAPDNIFSAGKR